jgi:hypothetical protein
MTFMIKLIKDFLYKLVMGHPDIKKYIPTSFYKKQQSNLSQIWNNKTYKDFGIERLIRIILQLIAFITPGGVVRYFTTTKNLLIRKLGIEFYGIFKIFFISLAFQFDWTQNPVALFFIVVFTLDTLHFLVCRVLLNDIFREAISHRRSLIMTFINYIEICLCFAFIYSFIDDTNNDIKNSVFITNENLPVIDGHLNDTQTIYFSFVTAATIGYGDISPKDPLVMKLVIVQILVSLFFVVVFVSNIINKLGEDTFYNKKKQKEIVEKK